MRRELREELDRLIRLAERCDAPIELREGATEAELEEAEERTGIRFNDDFRDLYTFSNGSKYLETWFVACTRELEPFWFYPLHEACRVHSWVPAPMCDESKNNGGVPRDPRVQRLDRHTKWFPFADHGNGSSIAYFDADPTAEGHYGQIITFQNAPDIIRWCATDLVSFLRASNDLLEVHGARLLAY